LGRYPDDGPDQRPNQLSALAKAGEFKSISETMMKQRLLARNHDR
jgi:hypothetical protein